LKKVSKTFEEGFGEKFEEGFETRNFLV